MGGRGGVPTIALLLLISSACAGRAGVTRLEGVPGPDGAGVSIMNARRVEGAGSSFSSLLVENRSGYQVAVRLNGVRLGTATYGRTCIRVPKTVGEMQLEFVPVGMAAQLAPLVYLEWSSHWRVELTPGVTLKYDVLSLAPSHGSCET